MSTQYLPQKEALFAAWASNFTTLVSANPAKYGYTPAQASTVASSNATYQAAYTLCTSKSTKTASAVTARNNARAAITMLLRPMAVAASLNPAVAPADKQSLGVTVRQTTPTPVPAPVDAPVINVVKAVPGSCQYNYKIAGSSNKAKPQGSVGMQVWGSFGVVAATDPTQCTLLGVMTKSPFSLTFTTAQQGKIITLFARFVTRGGPGGQSQVGPWSAPLTTTVM